jgi:acyl carrier protein
MTRQERTKKVIIESLGVADELVVPAAEIEGDLGADSLDVVELVMAIEDEFAIEIPDDDVRRENFNTVQDLDNYLAKRGIS